MATLTLAPFYLFPLLIPAFTGLYKLVDKAPTHRRAFLDGWWWGWGFYMTGLYWFCIALLTDAEKFAWLIPFALFGLTAVIAIYCGAACWISHKLNFRGLTKLIMFATVWSLVEFLRGHLFSGFPWNLAGYSFGFTDAAMQMDAVFGIYGLTWFAVLLGLSVAALAYGKPGRIFFASVWGVYALGMLWGGLRIHDVQGENVPGVTLRLVQGNVSQNHKWDPRLQMQGLDEYIKLTQQPGLDKVTHVIWPETAVPYIVEPGGMLSHVLGDTVPEGKILITGALRAAGDPDDWKIYNSLMAFNHGGSIVGYYDKVKLVPFGEFIPLRFLLPKSWLTPVGDKDFSYGKRGVLLEWPGLNPYIPLICYEVIFPEMTQSIGGRPDWMLNITNDAWFGESSGPYQHFAMARMRAVEQGVPLVRVANTGITAAIDGYGRVISSIPLNKEGILDIKLPKSLPENKVFEFINKLFPQFLVLITIILLYRQRTAKNN